MENKEVPKIDEQKPDLTKPIDEQKLKEFQENQKEEDLKSDDSTDEYIKLLESKVDKLEKQLENDKIDNKLSAEYKKLEERNMGLKIENFALSCNNETITTYQACKRTMFLGSIICLTVELFRHLF